jgi:hypothetical protein
MAIGDPYLENDDAKVNPRDSIAARLAVGAFGGFRGVAPIATYKPYTSVSPFSGIMQTPYRSVSQQQIAPQPLQPLRRRF